MDDRPIWFAPKRYGYGTGLPVAWQGWAAIAGFFAVVILAGALLKDKPGLMASIIFPELAIFLSIAARTTHGGWRWRWGDPD
ncbi:hypothetical protein [Sphingomonas sp.]|uniref:hypothetical protein n=1 Tax=Sphingomonas sp. TaxID=28214 RepID=UPI0025ED4D03|nr:hypothetical protein [Sphingomonas sp.]